MQQQDSSIKLLQEYARRNQVTFDDYKSIDDLRTSIVLDLY